MKEDAEACNGSFLVVVVDEAFDGVSPLDRARKVNGIIAEEIKQLHAITIKCWTSAQWEKHRSKYE